jgi:hypothetical protein
MRISTDLTTWYSVGDALAVLPRWASRGATWAPTVLKTATGYTLYFAARDRTSGRECIGSATSTNITGPYTPQSTPAVCQRNLGGDIDPYVFTSSTGQSWLLWKNDGNCCDETVSLWAQPLGGYGVPTGQPTRLLSAGATWEHGVIENPAAVEHGGVIVLLYSGGHWNSSQYGTGTAICSSLSSPCVRQSTSGPTIGAIEGTAGDGGASVFVDSVGVEHVALHAWSAGRAGRPGAVRSMWSGPLQWDGYRPVLASAVQAVLAKAPSAVTSTTSTTLPETSTSTTPTFIGLTSTATVVANRRLTGAS